MKAQTQIKHSCFFQSGTITAQRHSDTRDESTQNMSITPQCNQMGPRQSVLHCEWGLQSLLEALLLLIMNVCGETALWVSGWRL